MELFNLRLGIIKNFKGAKNFLNLVEIDSDKEFNNFSKARRTTIWKAYSTAVKHEKMKSLSRESCLKTNKKCSSSGTEVVSSRITRSRPSDKPKKIASKLSNLTFGSHKTTRLLLSTEAKMASFLAPDLISMTTLWPI